MRQFILNYVLIGVACLWLTLPWVICQKDWRIISPFTSNELIGQFSIILLWPIAVVKFLTYLLIKLQR